MVSTPGQGGGLYRRSGSSDRPESFWSMGVVHRSRLATWAMNRNADFRVAAEELIADRRAGSRVRGSRILLAFRPAGLGHGLVLSQAGIRD